MQDFSLKKHLIILLFPLLLLTSCGNPVQKEFIKAFKETTDQSSASFQVSITDVDIDKHVVAKSPNLNLLSMQQDSFKLSGDYTIDTKENSAFETNMIMEFLGKKVPFSMRGDIHQQYVSTDYITALAQLADSYSVSASQENRAYSQFDELHGKYIPFIYLLEDKHRQTPTEEELQKETAKIEQLTNEVKRELFAYLGSLDKEYFTSEKETITLRLHKKEVQEILALYRKICETSTYKDIFKNSFTPLDYQETLDDFETFDLTFTVNSQKKTNSLQVSLKPKNKQVNGIKKIVFSIDSETLPFSGTPTLPNQENIISKEELDKITQKDSK